MCFVVFRDSVNIFEWSVNHLDLLNGSCIPLFNSYIYYAISRVMATFYYYSQQ